MKQDSEVNFPILFETAILTPLWLSSSSGVFDWLFICCSLIAVVGTSFSVCDKVISNNSRSYFVILPRAHSDIVLNSRDFCVRLFVCVQVWCALAGPDVQSLFPKQFVSKLKIGILISNPLLFVVCFDILAQSRRSSSAVSIWTYATCRASSPP